MNPMNDVPRQSLKKIVQQFGAEVADDPRRCEALLRDFCPEYRREIFVLVTALEEGVAEDLRVMTAQLPYSVVLPRLAQELHETTALSADAARWGVDVWADALSLAAGAATAPATQVSTGSSQDAPGFRLVHKLAAHTGVVADLAFSPDGRQLVSVGMDTAAHIWDVATGTGVTSLRQQTGILTSVAWHPDGLSLALGSGDWGVYLWRWPDPGSETPRLRGHQGLVTRVVFLPGGGTLASAGRDAVIHLWDIETGEIQTTLRGHTDAILDLALSTDGRTLASAGGWDRTVRIWDLPQAQELWTLTGHTAQVTGVSFGTQRATLASGSWDESVRLWDLKRGQERTRLHQDEDAVHLICTVALAPGGDLLAAGDWQGGIGIWHVQRRELLGRLAEHSGHIRRVAFSPQGDWLASADDTGTLCLWRTTAHRR